MRRTDAVNTRQIYSRGNAGSRTWPQQLPAMQHGNSGQPPPAHVRAGVWTAQSPFSHRAVAEFGQAPAAGNCPPGHRESLAIQP